MVDIDTVHNRVQLLLGRVGLAIGCHQIRERSFVFRGRQVPLCSRCCGIFVGFAFSLVLRVGLVACFVIMLPLLLDGITQAVHMRQSRNWLRVCSGILFGIGFSKVVVAIITYGIHNFEI